MRKLLIITLVVVSSIVHGQIPEIKWQACFGTPEINRSYGITNTDNGYLLALGTTDGEGLPNYHGGGDIWLVETDTLGNLIWQKCYGGSDSDGPFKIVRENDFYYILAGTTSTDGDVQSANNGGIDYATQKMNEYKNKAGEILDTFPENEARVALHKLSDFTISRKS